ncbi:hypothetical protein [Halosegnis marinus]|uniref:Uncharacterized protein n=1 Tax=Halosegnis marinus TaxID=3034023 RepID=A0ABD5ZT24_9EURY|nr:hypothetical protein [Halosegnis sp. DT85]
MEERTLERLKHEYPTASWALWSSSFPDDGCVEEDPTRLGDYISERRESLRPAIVLLSLNPSTHLPSDFQNFHSTNPKHQNDQFRDYVVNAGLEGAYMTDLVERVNPDSNAVEVKDEDIDTFLDQLELLGEDHYYVICFLNDVFVALREAFNGREVTYPHNILGFSAEWNGITLDCFKVYFHANWGVNQDKTPDEQLQYLSNNVVGEDRQDLSKWVE